jgi:Na+/H+ antiporter NhaD/arsenite permease-like protein
MRAVGGARRERWLGGGLGVLVTPALSAAAEHEALDLPLWTVAPFALLLLAIAVLPLLAGRFWHHNRNKALVSLVAAAPVAGYLLYLAPHTEQRSVHALVESLHEYASFIILLAALYTVSGGIVLQGYLAPRPMTNTLFLAFGAVLANLIGTTGASVLLIRPLLRINRSRQNTYHLPIFFIFSVSNLGGLLTPLGDPPLFLGFLRGVDFFWTMTLWPQWLVANGLVLTLFAVWDTIAWRREPPPEDGGESYEQSLGLRGLINVLFLAGILAGVLFRSADVGRAAALWLSQGFPCPDLTLPAGGSEGLMVAMAVLSWLLTPQPLRLANGFTWGPIVEVAVLFAGIFVAMVPALELLRAHGQQLGIQQPWQFFWLTGLLSSCLDNAPTYLTFATLAASPGSIANLSTTQPVLLQAVSCGAVFMGAMTYIGNGPNFMVKAIADEAGFRTPSFFGYLAYAAVILVPVFVLITGLFFL